MIRMPPRLLHQKLGRAHFRMPKSLIEEQCSTVCFLKSASLASEGPSERSFLVSEQSTLDQIRIERRAVDVHERPFCAPAGLVYALRDEFFTRARLADDEDVHVVDTRGKIDVLPDSLYQ